MRKRITTTPSPYTFGNSPAAINIVKIAGEYITADDTNGTRWAKKIFTSISEHSYACSQLAQIKDKQLRISLYHAYFKAAYKPMLDTVLETEYHKLASHAGNIMKTDYRRKVLNLGLIKL